MKLFKKGLLAQELLARGLLALLAFIALHYLHKFCEKETDGFRLSRICSSLSFNPAWETRPLSENEKEGLKAIFDQKFSYLASGGQCFVFASEDQRYVLKFFKHHLRHKPAWMNKIPFLRKKCVKCAFKLQRDFTSCRLAFDLLQKETGLLLVHLNKTKDLRQTVTLIDKLGIAHILSLDDKEFILQKKATLVYDRLHQLMAEQELEQAKQCIHSLFHVILERSAKGVFDEDAKIHRNFGFIGNEAVVFDTGRFVLDETMKRPERYKKDLRKNTLRFKKWLQDEHPLLIPYLESTIDEIEKNA